MINDPALKQTGNDPTFNYICNTDDLKQLMKKRLILYYLISRKKMVCEAGFVQKQVETWIY